MYTVKRTGTSARSTGAELRALVRTEQPKVMAKALTFTIQRGQKDIVAEMPKVFEGGATRYTLNSTRIEPATAQKLSARVAVKDRTAGGGNVPENYLFPSVYAGTRREKRMEKALRLDGLLPAGHRVMPGDFAQLDAQGNVKVGELRSILNALRQGKGRAAGKVFVGRPGGPKGQLGVYRRKGSQRGGDKKVEPLLIFTPAQPTYRRRLDFEGTVRRTAEREFPAIFARLLRADTKAR